MARALLLTIACLLVLSAASTDHHPPALEAASRPAPMLFDRVASEKVVATGAVEHAAVLPALPLRI